MFEGKALPAGSTRLKATPFFNSSPELTTIHGSDGPLYIVLSPKNPQNALLVIEPQSKPEDIAARKSVIYDFTGESVGLSSPALAEHVKSTYGLELQKNSNGEIDALKLSEVPAASKESGAS